MSAPAARASLAVPAALFHCPACKVHFRAPPSSQTPLLLECAHTVCSECIEALQTLEFLCCPVCDAVTSDCTHNYAMAEAAEAAWAEAAFNTGDGDVTTAAASVCADSVVQDEDVPMPGAYSGKALCALLDRLTAASTALQAGSERVSGTRAGLKAHVEASIVDFEATLDDVIAKVNEYRASTKAAVRAVCADRVKALEAQADELAVSAGQLTACVAGGNAAMARGNPASVEHAFRAALAMVVLERAAVLPRVPLRLGIAADVRPTLASLAGLARLRLYEVDASRSGVSGNGLRVFEAGPRRSGENVITVTCRDAAGMAADWVTADDVAVSVNRAGGGDVVGHVASAAVVETGVLEVTFEVSEEGVSEVELSVSVCGVTLGGGPWRVWRGCKAEGVHVTSLPVNNACDNRGLAITSDSSHMVVSNFGTHQLSVYRLSDGSHVRSFGSEGEAAGQFRSPCGLCMTKENTILVADYRNKRIQEMTLEGGHVKCIGVGVINDGVRGIAMHGDVVAVGKSGGRTPDRIMLFSYTSGALLSKFGAIGSGEGQYYNVTGMEFTADGKHLFIASSSNEHVSLATVEGVFVRYIGAGVLGGGYKDVTLTRAGEVVVADYYNHRVCVFSQVDGTLLRTWCANGTGNSPFNNPTALTTSRNRLYVLDEHRARVHVFE